MAACQLFWSDCFYLYSNHETVVPHVADSEDQAELPVSLADHGILAEHNRTRPAKLNEVMADFKRHLKLLSGGH